VKQGKNKDNEIINWYLYLIMYWHLEYKDVINMNIYCDNVLKIVPFVGVSYSFLAQLNGIDFC